MECDRNSYGASDNIWVFFYEDFNYFTTKDFDRLGQCHLKELRKYLRYFKVYVAQDYEDLTIAQCLVNVTKEETYRPWTEENAKALPIEALPIEALSIGKALPIEALPVETNESAIPVETNERNEPAILFATVIEPSMGTSTSSIPKSQSTTTLVSPQSIPFTSGCLAYTLSLPSSIPATGFGQFHAFQRTNGSVTPTYTSAGFEFQASQRTGVG
jgi:hypothetical protein